MQDMHALSEQTCRPEMPAKVWHDAMEDPILDRLIHTAHHIALKGESMWKGMTEWQADAHQSGDSYVNQPQPE